VTGPPISNELEPTLGEILGAALAGVLPDPEIDEQALAERARYHAALELAEQLGPLFAVTQAEVFDALCTIPDNMLSLLETPEGWAALAGYLAADFRMPLISYQPTIH
jgi:hypothetical protein